MDTDLYMAVPNWFCKHPDGSEVGFTIRKALKAIPGVPQALRTKAVGQDKQGRF